MASAGPVVPPLLPAAALRPYRSVLEAAPAEELEDCADGRAGIARLPRGTPCAKVVSFSYSLAAGDEGGGGAYESPLSVGSQPSAQGLAWMRSRPSPIPYSRKDHVWFNSPMNSAHPITPYAEVYGVHPRFFNFDRSGNKVSSHADADVEAAVELEKAAAPGARGGGGEEPEAPDYSPQVNCMANYGYSCGRSYVAPAPAHTYDLSMLMPAGGFGHQPPLAACALNFGFPDTAAAAYGMRSLGPGAADGDLNYAAYGYGYGLMAQQLLAAQRPQEVPTGGLPRPR